jgi:hypothetical protein
LFTNVLKLTYEHLIFLKFFLRLYLRTPLKGEGKGFGREGERGIGGKGMEIGEERDWEGRRGPTISPPPPKKNPAYGPARGLINYYGASFTHFLAPAAFCYA